MRSLPVASSFSGPKTRELSSDEPLLGDDSNALFIDKVTWCWRRTLRLCLYGHELIVIDLSATTALVSGLLLGPFNWSASLVKRLKPSGINCMALGTARSTYQDKTTEKGLPTREHRPWHVAMEQPTLLGGLLLLIIPIVVQMLLLLAGDVERNPGPFTQAASHELIVCGRPCYAEKLELKAVSAGDHLLTSVCGPPYVPCYRSSLVVSVEGDAIIAILNCSKTGGIREEKIDRNNTSIKFYKVVYDHEYQTNEAIARARKRLEAQEKCFHCLSNNSHHFVTWAKTGKEDSLLGITGSLNKDVPESDEGASMASEHSYTVPTDSTDGSGTISPTDTALVPALIPEGATSTASEHPNGGHLSSDDISGTTIPTDTALIPEGATSTASEHPNGGHLSSDDISGTTIPTGLQLKPVLTKVPVERMEDIEPADHVMTLDDLNRPSHVIVKQVQSGTITAFTTRNAKVIEMEIKRKPGRIYRIEYDCSYHRSAETIVKTAERLCASSASHEYKDSSAFATEMKTGKAYLFNEGCLFSLQEKPLGCTKVTDQVSMLAGTHVLEKSGDGKWQSLIVEACVGNQMVLLKPISHRDSLDIAREVYENWHERELFRVNYKQSLLPATVLERLCSAEAKHVMTKCKGCASSLISWAKTGRTIAVEFEDLTSINQMEDKHPLFKERIHHVNDIKVGDHIIQHCFHVKWEHYLITECQPHVNAFTAISCGKLPFLRTRELSVSFDLVNDATHRVIYPECLPADEVIHRARSKMSSKSTPPGNLVLWAKTGSEKGIDSDFLASTSQPVTKSRILSFMQLNPGDHLVIEASKRHHPFAHHYLVTEIHSPIEFTGIESFHGIFEKTVNLHAFQGDPKCYRINYTEEACQNPMTAVGRARGLMKSMHTILHIRKPTYKWSYLNREAFVRFVKTGEKGSVDVETLPDERLCLPRERIQSAKQLYPGDHIERPLQSKVGEMRKAYHHMLVAEAALDDRNCKVLHFTTPDEHQAPRRSSVNKIRQLNFDGKMQVKEDVTDIFVMEEVVRVRYPERLNPQKSIDQLRWNIKESTGNRSNDEGSEEMEMEDMATQPETKFTASCAFEPFAHGVARKGYHFTDNNCEDLIMEATTGESISIQVDDAMRKAITYNRNAVKPIGIAISSSAMRATQKGVGKAACLVATAPGHVSRSTTRAAAQASGFRVGYDVAVSSFSLGVAAGAATLVAIPTETALLAYSMQRHYRKRQLGLISEDDLRKEFIKEHCTAVSTAICSILGAVIGTVAIPVPVLGATVGGFVGCLGGQGIGYAEGKLVELVYDYYFGGSVDLPYICTRSFNDCGTIESK